MEEVSISKPLDSWGNAVYGLSQLGVEEEEKQEESKKNEDQVEISLEGRLSHSLLH